LLHARTKSFIESIKSLGLRLVRDHDSPVDELVPPSFTFPIQRVTGIAVPRVPTAENRTHSRTYRRRVKGTRNGCNLNEGPNAGSPSTWQSCSGRSLSQEHPEAFISETCVLDQALSQPCSPALVGLESVVVELPEHLATTLAELVLWNRTASSSTRLQCHLSPQSRRMELICALRAVES